MKAFISYSTDDREVARNVKSILNKYSIDSFLAHEDINVSQEWKTRIVRELGDSEIIIPLLSASFKGSEWAPQEIGFAFGRGDVLFIPLSIDGTTPFGFISHIQGKRIPDAGLNNDLLIDPIMDRFPHDIIPRLIERLRGAKSYVQANALMLPLVSRFSKFNDTEINAFATAAIENGQIWDAGDCRQEYLPKFLDLHKSRMDDNQHVALEYQVKHGRWYHLRDVNAT